MINENPDNGEKSPFDDPESIHYEDPSDMTEDSLLNTDTDIISADDIKK